MNDERLKQGEHVFGKDYFKELLERVRSIRASERRIYLQITESPRGMQRVQQDTKNRIRF